MWISDELQEPVLVEPSSTWCRPLPFLFGVLLRVLQPISRGLRLCSLDGFTLDAKG